jgi:hypothetical protein
VLKVAHNNYKTTKLWGSNVKKIAFITVWLIEDPEAYKGKTNSDIEKEILKEVGPIPYAASVEKVTVIDFQTQTSTCPT